MKKYRPFLLIWYLDVFFSSLINFKTVSFRLSVSGLAPTLAAMVPQTGLQFGFYSLFNQVGSSGGLDKYLDFFITMKKLRKTFLTSITNLLNWCPHNVAFCSTKTKILLNFPQKPFFSKAIKLRHWGGRGSQKRVNKCF